MKLSLDELYTVRDALFAQSDETNEAASRTDLLLSRIDKKIAKVKAAALAGGIIKAAPTTEGG